MPVQNLDDRHEENMSTLHNYPIAFPIALTLIILGILIGVGISRVDGFLEGTYTEVFGIIITVGLIDILHRQRERNEGRKRQNIISSNAIKFLDSPRTHPIFFEMIVNDLLRGFKTTSSDLRDFKCKKMQITGAMFRHMNFRRTDWVNANLSDNWFRFCDLRDSKFFGCNLTGTEINTCDLSNAEFHRVILRNSKIYIIAERIRIYSSDFSDADLTGTNLSDAMLVDVDLSRANLTDVRLQGAQFADIRCDGNTILPNGDKYDASLGMEQFSQFINPNHEGFYAIDQWRFATNHIPSYEKND